MANSRNPIISRLAAKNAANRIRELTASLNEDDPLKCIFSEASKTIRDAAFSDADETNDELLDITPTHHLGRRGRFDRVN